MAKVFIINCDWRDIFRSEPQEFEDKLRRDHLGPERNQFFFLSFAKVNYEVESKNYTTVHQKTYLGAIKPLLDLKALVTAWFVVWRRGWKPDIWLTYDFGFLPALWLARACFGGIIVAVLTNQPRIYSRTRRLGRIRAIYSALGERLWRFIPDKFMTINETMKTYLEDLGVPAAQIAIFSTDTIRRDQHFIDQAVAGRVKVKLHLPPETKIVLSVGRLETEKNYPRLLELFVGLPPSYVLIILGQGSFLPTLKARAQSLGVAERVFFEGFVNRQQIWDYYLDADVFVLISKAEALGMVFWEAMYLGLPIIGSVVPGIVETVGSDGERGRLWAESEGEAVWRDKVIFCSTDSPAKAQMIERAKTFVLEKVKNDVTLNDMI